MKLKETNKHDHTFTFTRYQLTDGRVLDVYNGGSNSPNLINPKAMSVNIARTFIRLDNGEWEDGYQWHKKYKDLIVK